MEFLHEDIDVINVHLNTMGQRTNISDMIDNMHGGDGDLLHAAHHVAANPRTPARSR